MKKNTIEKIKKEIDEKTKLPHEIKERIKKEVFTNILIASIIILYFIFIILGSAGSIKNVRVVDLNIFSFLFLGIAIFLFEIAYRKDNGKFAMYGLESLILAIFTLFLPYIIFELDETNKKHYLMFSIYIASYYILKSIIISAKTRNKYINSNLSDVKEIVRKEKSKRRIKDDIEETDVGVGVPDDPKKGQSKKTIQKQEKTPKKRGRPKKSETTINEDKPKARVDDPVNPKPKKRGRPRKAVINND